MREIQFISSTQIYIIYIFCEIVLDLLLTGVILGLAFKSVLVFSFYVSIQIIED